MAPQEEPPAEGELAGEEAEEEGAEAFDAVAYRQGHNRRQRGRNRERRQCALVKILERATLTSDGLAELFEPIPSLAALTAGCEAPLDADAFWGRVPEAATPDRSELTLDVASAGVLRVQYSRQNKMERRLRKKLRDGDITEEEMGALLAKHGRALEGEGDGGSKGFTMMSADRGRRKREQIENFASMFWMRIHEGAVRGAGPAPAPGAGLRPVRRVVDLGCGSGHLCLSLAAFFPDVHFLGVDQNETSVALLEKRAEIAGLKNVSGLAYEISEADLKDDCAPLRGVLPAFDVCIGLHCCGSFTDLVMEISAAFRADCVVCPCCNGKTGCQGRRQPADAAGGPGEEGAAGAGPAEELICPVIRYPRSDFLRRHVTERELLESVTLWADDPEHAYGAKCLIEYDRACWGREHPRFRSVAALKLTPETCSPKHHVLYLHALDGA